MRLPRDLTGREIASGLQRLGYAITRQTGSHMRLTTLVKGEHHLTVPDHDPVRVGTLASIITSVAEHHEITREDVLRILLD
jgi:predicted RNA binding protein YcfA (HicA-like mRNA interferase family)